MISCNFHINPGFLSLGPFWFLKKQPLLSFLFSFINPVNVKILIETVVFGYSVKTCSLNDMNTTFSLTYKLYTIEGEHTNYSGTKIALQIQLVMA